MSGEPLVPSPALTTRQAAGKVFAAQVRLIAHHEKGARHGGEPEDVHQMRVATRRLRAALRLFEGFLAPRKRIRMDLPWIARRLGRVRDHDVVIALLEERHAEALGGAEAKRLEALLAGLKERRYAAQESLEKGLKHRRYEKLRRALDEFAKRPRFTGDEDVMAAKTLAEAIEERGGIIAEDGAMTEPHPTPDQLHGLRIEFKRLRYVLDFHSDTCGLAYEVERKLTRDLQECLGELHDHDLLLYWLELGEDFFAGPWRTLQPRLAEDRKKLFRRFLRLRKQWLERTQAEPTVATTEEPKFVSLEAAPVTLRLITTPKQVASTMIR
ncbi:MAG: CHAD domain-containing protein [Gemmatimonadota bacterium]